MISGTEPCRAVWTATDAWAAPGPRLAKKIPGRPVSCPWAHAMLAQLASIRPAISRICGVS